MLYFDNAATTKISKTSLEEYIKASECFFNPSSLYADSGKSKALVEEARGYVLKTLKAPNKSTLVFLSSTSISPKESIIIR